MSLPLLPSGLHNRWRAIHVGTAKCDVCNRNSHQAVQDCLAAGCHQHFCKSCAEDRRRNDPDAIGMNIKYFGTAHGRYNEYFIDTMHIMGPAVDWQRH